MSGGPPHGALDGSVPSPARRRLMVVDDDPKLLRAVGRALRRYPDIHLTTYDNGIDALLGIAAARPDLVVMDVYMPGLDGIEACRRLKTHPDTRDIRVILTSGAMTDELQATALAAGAARAIAKPMDLETLLEEACPREPAHAPAERVPTVRAADLLVQMLADAGVEVVFGLPGAAISPVHDALLDSSIRVVTTRHESGAMFAAAGYAHGTGKLGVVAVTSGPGVLNAMTGLASAWCDGLPVLLLVGEVPRRAHGKGVLQDGSSYGLRVAEMAAPVSKLVAEVPTANALPHLLRRAITTALSGKRGPVVLTLPMDITTAEIAVPQLGGEVTVSTAVATELLDEVVRLFGHAERPLILAGSGVRGGDASARLVGVAERLRCPVVTTPKGKGVFPEDHRLALGVIGLGGHPSARRYLDAGVDLVLAIGTSLGDLATDGFDPLLQAPAFVHVDIDARQVGRSYVPTHAIVASASEFLTRLATRLARAPSPMLHTRLETGVLRHLLPAAPTPGRIAPDVAITEIQALLPADTIFTIDSGEHFLFAAHYLEITRPDAFLFMAGLGSMGQSIGAALGAHLAQPHRSVAAICGDGCFAMNAFEVATAVAERIPIRVFVFNDERLGMVENGHEEFYGRRADYPTRPMDICALAHGLGAATLRVDAPGQLAAAAEIFRAATGPVVVDVRIDPAVRLPKRDRVAGWKTSDSPTPPIRPPKRVVPHLKLVT